MANPFFQFKQFTVWHDKCAMKVGTDGVLLGAWSDADGSERILDVGCGTGLISLMMAQRFPADIDALDIEESACIQAQENVCRSPFAGRIHVIHTPFDEYVSRYAGKKKYDCIVSNPPYFINSTKCPNLQRNTARHTDTLPLEMLIRGSKALLTDRGRICLVLPSDRIDLLIHIIDKEQFFLHKLVNVYPTPNSRPKRLLAELRMQPCGQSPQTSRLIIEEERHLYTDEFIALVKEYYLYL